MMESHPKWLKDELDRKIIRELQRNARESTTNIAARLNVARSTVHERISRMEKQGTISGYSVVLSRNPSVENVQVIVFLEIKQQESRKVLHRISQYSEVRVCLSINGDFDLFEDLDIVIDEIGALPGVLRTKSYVVFGRRFDRRYKETAQRIAEQVFSGDD